MPNKALGTLQSKWCKSIRYCFVLLLFFQNQHCKNYKKECKYVQRLITVNLNLTSKDLIDHWALYKLSQVTSRCSYFHLVLTDKNNKTSSRVYQDFKVNWGQMQQMINKFVSISFLFSKLTSPSVTSNCKNIIILN